MSSPRTQNPTARALLFLGAFALAFALYAADVPRNPPGFYIDESSIAYNAHLVSEGGRDEYGEPWPLYFRAFGDYKNPVYVYLLAAVFRVTGPSLLTARLLSAGLGALAALLLGLLAARMTGRAEAGAVVSVSALLTPWLYESSRLVFEVAAYPVVCAFFLLALRRASREERWDAFGVASVAASLALLTYTYSIGRLLGPLLALGLVFFVTRRNLARVVQTWTAYALTLIPLLVYALRHPGALGGRFSLITYVTPQSSVAEDARGFVLHYLADVNPWRWLVTGEQNIRDHLPDAPALLAATLLLTAAGLGVVIFKQRREAWWRFVLYALAASVVPAALTVNEFPQLRLVAVPVFLHVLLAPAVAWLLEGGKRRRAVLYAASALVLAQGAHFQWRFHARPPERWYVFDARFPRKILAPALEASRGARVYLYDPPGHSGYIQALWHGTLGGVEPSRFVRLDGGQQAPPGAVVISTEETCADCRLLARSINYILYAVPPTDLKPAAAALPPEQTRASLECRKLPPTLSAGERRRVEVIVRNVGGATWPAVGDEAGRYAVLLRQRWTKADGSPIAEGNDAAQAPSDEGAARIPFDMEPGDTAGLTIELVAPEAPGEYVLELGVVQEGVGRFGAGDSKPLRAGVRVLPPG
ncbi:MAG TPA: glycosyltransferase family 39 protein [Pyrinomonadaceae bacterium]|nr:glycosyltransferase family 39 protein [Pyrinomonadaceae bacterium]